VIIDCWNKPDQKDICDNIKYKCFQKDIGNEKMWNTKIGIFKAEYKLMGGELKPLLI